MFETFPSLWAIPHTVRAMPRASARDIAAEQVHAALRAIPHSPYPAYAAMCAGAQNTSQHANFAFQLKSDTETI
jgi:hypothetical protein